MLGEERVTKFVIQEIVDSSMADYVKKASYRYNYLITLQTEFVCSSSDLLGSSIYQENLSVKDNKINTSQTAEELKSSFSPGNEFGFNATLELEKTKSETTN